MLPAVLVAGFAAVAALGAGCGGDDDEVILTATSTATSAATTLATASRTATATSTATASATGTSVATATKAPTTLPAENTGVPAVDAAIAAVFSGDTAKVVALVKLRSLGCGPQTGIGSPPACPAGQPTGTMVDILPVATCEGEFRGASTVAASFAPVVNSKPALYAVYGMPQQFLTLMPEGQYVAVFSRDATGQGRLGAGVVIGGGRIVGLWYGCGAPADQIVPAGTSVILPPRA
jgi:hypothetical protein